MSILVQIRMSSQKVKILDILIERGIYKNRTQAIETFVNEGLEKRGLIDYSEVDSD